MANSLNPKVTVVVPNYNHARFLRQRVDSILRQTFQDFEVILLDDCSIDDSRAILSEYEQDPRVRMQFNKENSGSTFKQWNKGVRLARGEYVWIAESDDYADERFIQILLSRLDNNPATVFSYCRSRQVSEEGEAIDFVDLYHSDLHPNRWTQDFLSDGNEECKKYLVHRNTVPSASSVIFRKDAYERVGGADESLLFCGDWKTWAAMALAGGTIAYVGEPLNYFRFHEMTVTSRSKQHGVDADEYLQVIRWILQRVEPAQATRHKLCEDLFPFWSSRVLSGHIPLKRRRSILRNALAIDHQALQKLFIAASVALRSKSCNLYRRLRPKS